MTQNQSLTSALANEAAKARILASGRELDPEGDRLSEIYDSISQQFNGVSLEGMLKVLSSYVVDQAFLQCATYSEGTLAARDMSKEFDQMAQDYCRLKLKNFSERDVSQEELKAELEGALRVMRQNPELASGGLVEMTEATLAGG